MPTPTRLSELPASFVTTRDALHQVAFFALAPRRHQVEQRLGLVATPGGFGTPWFSSNGGRERVRMEADQLVVEVDDQATRTRPVTVREACTSVGIDHRPVWFEGFHDPLSPVDPDRSLVIDPLAAEVLGEWFAFGTAALASLADVPGVQELSAIQLWPEHFDPAREAGSAAEGRRASYGASPGDAEHPEPYLYVAPWGPHPEGDYWNDPSFAGASMSYSELRLAADPLAAAAAFLRQGHALLAAG